MNPNKIEANGLVGLPQCHKIQSALQKVTLHEILFRFLEDVQLKQILPILKYIIPARVTLTLLNVIVTKSGEHS